MRVYFPYQEIIGHTDRIFGYNPFTDKVNHPCNDNYNPNIEISLFTLDDVVCCVFTTLCFTKENIERVLSEPIDDYLIDHISATIVDVSLTSYLYELYEEDHLVDDLSPYLSRAVRGDQDIIVDYRGNEVSIRRTLTEEEHDYLCIMVINILRYLGVLLPELYSMKYRTEQVFYTELVRKQGSDINYDNDARLRGNLLATSRGESRRQALRDILYQGWYVNLHLVDQ